MSARVLVIDDNATNLELMSYLLEAFGHEVLAARSGAEGLETARRIIPDLIICDIEMPGMNGYEVAGRLGAVPALSTIPLIAVTALAMVDDRAKVLDEGFDGYITKPIVPETFVAEVEAFLPSAEGKGAPSTAAPGSPRTWDKGGSSPASTDETRAASPVEGAAPPARGSTRRP